MFSSAKSSSLNRRSLQAVFPKLADTKIIKAWGGIVESTADVVPIIDESGAIPGYYIAMGVSGHGFGIGPGADKATAGMLSKTYTGIDLSEFRLGRFFDSSKLRSNVQA